MGTDQGVANVGTDQIGVDTDQRIHVKVGTDQGYHGSDQGVGTDKEPSIDLSPTYRYVYMIGMVIESVCNISVSQAQSFAERIP